MGLTLSPVSDGWSGGNQRVATVEATFDTDYVSGDGEFFNATTLSSGAGVSLSSIEHVDIVEGVTGKGYVVRWNESGERLHAFESSADGNSLDEVGTGKNDLANETVQLKVWGRS